MVNAVVGLDSCIKIAGINAGFKVMCSGIGLFISSHFGCIVFVNLKGEILYEAR